MKLKQIVVAAAIAIALSATFASVAHAGWVCWGPDFCDWIDD